ncbi:uncharacterized protein LOC132799609 [Ziziphus jujuba]|uniref:Uncharacterized protein LOC132799609 n=1 Tax=Ziziphus jujuba TaxID=326968 RepID=A0ABM3ZTT0_ZIZJJ|nr:uncharacterized protein LOC132799609 [Ziziphus jujuba]
MVSSLMESDGSWNMERIRLLFNRDTVNNICKIPCTNRNLDHKLIWIGNSNGCFSVKSAYKMEFYDKGVVSQWWKHIWTSKIHERLKFFLWKLANNGLTTASNLLSRNMVINRRDCVHGCGQLESSWHLFFLCQITRALWFAMPSSIKWDSLQDKSLKQKLNLLINPSGTLPTNVLSSIPYGQVEKAKAILSQTRTEGMATHSNNTLWEKPPCQSIKINTDAAVKEGKSMIGVVARNHLGEVQKIKAVRLQSDIPELAEAFGVLQGLKLASKEGWSKVWCQSDARNVITKINNPTGQNTHWAAEGIFTDIVRLKHQCLVHLVS